jgi:hypothetical protein
MFGRERFGCSASPCWPARLIAMIAASAPGATSEEVGEL